MSFKDPVPCDIKFLSPPVSMCTQCEKKLTMRNNPSRATLFTLDAPIPCWKVTLECRDCAIRFGVCNFKDKCGTLFYPLTHDIPFIEVSNVTYFHRNLYKWMPSLSNHCWVSFSGFAEAYNKIYEKQIQKCGSFCKEPQLIEDKSSPTIDLDECSPKIEEESNNFNIPDTSLEAIDICLDKISEVCASDKVANASTCTFQGTTDFLLSNHSFVENQSTEGTLMCNKDTGGLKV